MKGGSNVKTAGLLTALAALIAFSPTVFAAEGGGNAAPAGVDLQVSMNPQPVTVTFSGKVTDAATKAPIANAKVCSFIFLGRNEGPELFDLMPFTETTTDSSGGYAVSFTTFLSTTGPMKGQDNGSVFVSAPGYATAVRYVGHGITPEKTSLTGVDFALAPGHHVKGRLVDSAGSPLAGALIRTRNGANGDWNHAGAMGRTVTGADGSFELWLATDEGGEATPRWLFVSKDNYGVGTIWDLTKEDLGTITIQPGATITGQVVDVSGTGVANCEVVAIAQQFDISAKTTTDANGRYELKGIQGVDTVTDFIKHRGRSGDQSLIKTFALATIYARLDPNTSLRDVPQYQIVPKEGTSNEGPDLVVGADVSVTGTVASAGGSIALQGLLVRLDYDWGKMVEVDAKGSFTFKNVPPGKHRLTAYLPTNLRGDQGIGGTDINVEKATPLAGVRIQLISLAEARVQFVSEQGSPLAGITAGATWREDGGGFWTEGTVSGDDGWAVLYLYAGDAQYIRGFDMGEHKLVAASYEKVIPKAGEVIDNLKIMMVQPASVSGKLMTPDGQPLASKKVEITVAFADGGEATQQDETDAAGVFKLPSDLRPGVITVKVQTIPLEYRGTVASSVEVKPGEAKELPSATLEKIAFYKVSGKVLPSKNISDLKDIDIRLDLTGPWQMLGKTDNEGRFEVSAPAGKHRLTAYLPENARFDEGAGHTDVDVTGDLSDVAIQLLPMAMVKAKIVDESGKPLPGLRAYAAWNADLSGPGLESVKPSDDQGNTFFYVYAGEALYIGGYDRDRNWKFKFPADFKSVTLKENEVLEGVTLTMVPAGGE